MNESQEQAELQEKRDQTQERIAESLENLVHQMNKISRKLTGSRYDSGPR
jgi:hypothetical protein